MQIIFSLPRFPICNAIKKHFLSLLGCHVGKRVIFYPGIWIYSKPGACFSIGDDVDIALDVLINARGGLTIGNRVLIGYRTQILTTNHTIPKIPETIFGAGHVFKPVNIADDVWIGANVIVLPGVRIGKGSVIGAGSIVTKDIPEYVIAFGNPAKVMRERDR